MTDLFGAAAPAAVPAKRDDWPEDFADQFWNAAVRKTAKKAAMSALAKARKRKVSWAVLFAGWLRYNESKRGTEPPFILHPATWLNGDRWEDEPEPPAGGSGFFGIATGGR